LEITLVIPVLHQNGYRNRLGHVVRRCCHERALGWHPEIQRARCNMDVTLCRPLIQKGCLYIDWHIVPISRIFRFCNVFCQLFLYVYEVWNI